MSDETLVPPSEVIVEGTAQSAATTSFSHVARWGDTTGSALLNSLICIADNGDLAWNMLRFLSVDLDGNTSLGIQSADSTTGVQNTSVGVSAGRFLTTGSSNVLMGCLAGETGTSVYGIVAVGSEALRHNNAPGNTAVGYQALKFNTASTNNTALGHQSLLESNGQYNTAVGSTTGTTLVTGNNNILLGYDVDVDDPARSNVLLIGNGVRSTGFNGATYLSPNYMRQHTHSKTLTYDITTGEITYSSAAGGSDNLGDHVATLAIQGIDGSPAAPAYTFASDLASGMYSSGVNQVSIATDEAERLQIHNQGITVQGDVTADTATLGAAQFTGYTMTTDADYTINTGAGNLILSQYPAAANHAATKEYVDAVANGLVVKAPVRVKTAAALPAHVAAGAGIGKTLTQTGPAAQLVIDDVSVVDGDRVLVDDLGTMTGSDRGIYLVISDGSSGPWQLERSADADQNPELYPGMFTFILEGTQYADAGYVLSTNAPIQVDVTPLTFVQFSRVSDVTGTNIGAGAGQVYKNTVGTTLQFRTVAAGSTKLTVQNLTNTIELDVDPTVISHQDLAGRSDASAHTQYLTLDGSRAMTGDLQLQSANLFKLSLKAPSLPTADFSLIMPNSDGTSNQVLKTNGAGTLSWTSLITSHAGLSGLSADDHPQYLLASGARALTGALSLSTSMTFTAANAAVVTVQTPAAPATYALTLPTSAGSSGQYLQTNGSGVLSWQTVAAGNTFLDNVFRVQGSADATKQLALDVSAVSTGTTRTITMGNANGFIPVQLASSTNLLTGRTTVGSFSGAFNTAYGGLTLGAGTTGSSNAAFGYDCLSANTTGDANSAVGTNALKANVGGSQNTAVGGNALTSNTSGLRNSAFGLDALGFTVSVNDNTAFGTAALRVNTVAENTAVGSYALTANTTGLRNLAMGFEALKTSTTGNDLTAVGYQALRLATGASNTAMGSLSGTTVSTGTQNTLLGCEAGKAITTSSNSTLIGYRAGYVNTASETTAVGASALVANTSGARNSAVGYGCLAANTTGADNTSMGYTTATAITTGFQNTIIGTYAGLRVTTGSANTFIGYEAGSNMLVNNYSTCVGWGAGKSNTAFETTAMGNSALLSNTTGSRNVAIGSEALKLNTTGSNSTAMGYWALRNSTGDANTAFGTNVMAATTTSTGNTAMGYNSMLVATTGGAGLGYCTAVGFETLKALTTGFWLVALGANALKSATTAAETVAIGYRSLEVMTTAGSNTAVGSSTLSLLINGGDNTAIGFAAGYTCRGASTRNTAVGSNALTGGNSSSLTDATAVGHRALVNNVANEATAMGAKALEANTSGTGHAAFGFQALQSITTGTNCTAMGYQTLKSVTGSNNTGFGYQSGYTLSTGARNSVFGVSSMYNNSTGSDNCIFGYQTAANGGSAVNYLTAIGNQAAFNITSDGLSAFGYQAAYTNTSGTGGAAFGYQALYSNSTAANNSAFGYQALYLTTGAGNVGLGMSAGYTNSTGAQNTYLGTQTGYDCTTGSGNTAVGYQTMNSISTGSNNTFVGKSANVDATARSGCTVIGAQPAAPVITTTADNQLVLQVYGGNALRTDLAPIANMMPQMQYGYMLVTVVIGGVATQKKIMLYD